MWEYLATTLIISVITSIVCFFLFVKSYIDKDGYAPFLIATSVISFLMSAVIYGIGYANQTSDTEIWNGEVTGKSREEVSCSHSYSCNCRESCSGSGQNRSCTTICDTCYEHSHDYDWEVRTTIGEFDIDRIDRQGSREPPRWTKVKVGDPIAQSRTFTNYVKAVDSSLFNFETNANSDLDKYVPAYPRNIYDYHYLDRVIPVNMSANQIKDLPRWNYELALRLRKLGIEKQANIILMIAKLNDPNFEYSIKKLWLGGKKNDIIVILGTPNYPEIEWTRIVSWTDREDFKVNLRDALMDLKTVDMVPVLNTIEEHTRKTFIRKNMRDFEYLKYEIQVPELAYILGFILGPLGIIIASLMIVYEGKKQEASRRRLSSMFNRRFH